MHEADLSNEQLSRYSRHILLPEIDLEGQHRITQSKVTIIGAGGLGSPAAMYLAASGVGQITITDHDNIDLGNLQRQIAYRTENIGQKKSQAMAGTLSAINPEVSIQALESFAETEKLLELAESHDAIIDASDNFQTRFAINEACWMANTPLISGAAIRFQGQISVFNPREPESACYRCLYNIESEEITESCADRGIFSPLTGIVGSIQAAETLKLLVGTGELLTNRLLTIDALSMKIRTLKIKKDPKCPICSGR